MLYSPLVKAQTAAIPIGLIFLIALFAVGVSHWNKMTSSSEKCSFPDSVKLIFEWNMKFF